MTTVSSISKCQFAHLCGLALFYLWFLPDKQAEINKSKIQERSSCYEKNFLEIHEKWVFSCAFIIMKGIFR